MYDARGRGKSEGSPNGYGWKWTRDIAGAMRFLERRPDVEPGRIGALGLSTGADIVLEAAATRRDIRAVVTDGAAAGSFADWHHLQGTNAMTPFFWSQFAALRVFTGDAPGRPLADLVPRITAPMLLISTERHEEYDFNVKYARLARGRAEHWNIADVQHTHGLRDHPRAYEQQVAGFLDRALAERTADPLPSGADRIASRRGAPPTRTEERTMATRQQVQTAVGAHLVGGLKAPDPETAMRTAAGILGRHLRAVTDGETGDRSQWIFWQIGRLTAIDGIEMAGMSENPAAENEDYESFPQLAIDPSVTELPSRALGYADAAEASYGVYRRLREEGVIPADVKFQVSIPTPYATVVAWVPVRRRRCSSRSTPTRSPPRSATSPARSTATIS